MSETLVRTYLTAKGTIDDRLAKLEEDREAGLSTLEISVIALGLFAAATAAIILLTRVINNRLGQIN